jgi:hypothetical protein
MKNFTRAKWVGIVGACAITTGLMVGGGLAAANAAPIAPTAGSTHVEHHRGSDDATPTTIPSATATPTATPTHEAGEHATPEPGDDDAPGTTDHHGGRVGADDNPGQHHQRHRGSSGGAASNSGSTSGRHGGSDDGAGHDAGDDHGHGGGHGSDD